MKNATIKNIKFAADTINDSITSFNPGDVQFDDMIDIVSRLIEHDRINRDDEAYFANVRHELIVDLADEDNWPLTVSCAKEYAKFKGIEL